MGATAAIVAVSFVLAPGAWLEWFAIVPHHNATPGVDVPLLVRLPLALLLLWWGARGDRKWVMPIVVVIALPVVREMAFAMLIACVPLAWADATIIRWLPRAPAEPEPVVAGP
jgi:hypothetical protein